VISKLDLNLLLSKLTKKKIIKFQSNRGVGKTNLIYNWKNSTSDNDRSSYSRSDIIDDKNCDVLDQYSCQLSINNKLVNINITELSNNRLLNIKIENFKNKFVYKKVNKI
jgi:hypothetical protein